MKCLITVSPFGQDYSAGIARLEKMGIETKWNKTVNGCSDYKEVIKECDGYDYIIAGSEKWSAEALKACKQLKCLVRHGVGIDAVDMQATIDEGIAFANIPGANAKGVADHAICLMMSAAREIPSISGELHQGRIRTPIVPQVTSGVIGVVGTGNIGKTVIRYMSGMSCKFLAYDTYPDHEFAKQYHVEYVSLEELLAKSDVVTLHCPLLPGTRGLINREKLELMKKSAILINTSRGGVIVSEDLAEALKNKVIRCAALDVFEDEGGSEAMGKAFRNLDNAIITPHIASNTNETLDAMMDACIDVIENFSESRPIKTLLNPGYIANKRA